MNLEIRMATEADAILIADISRQTFYETFAAENTEADMRKFLDTQFTRGRLMLEVGAKENSFFIAYRDGAIAGYVKLRDGRVPVPLKKHRPLEIARLYALSTEIGTGVGRALMEKSIEVARAGNKDVVWLGVWEKNQRAIDFYNKWGFEKFDETDFLLGDDLQRDWLMRKFI